MIYKLEFSLKRNEIGRLPQCEEALWDGRFDNDSLSSQGRFGPIVGNPTLPKPLLHKRAKTPDNLMVAPILSSLYQVISPRFYNFLSSYLPIHQNWDLEVIHNEYKFDRKNLKMIRKEFGPIVKSPYKLLHISYPSNEIIDFPNCEYVIDNRENYLKNWKHLEEYINSEERETISFRSLEEYLHKVNELKELRKKNGQIIVAKKITLDIRDIPDIFRLMVPINNFLGYYVSEKLKNEIQEYNFTGFRFQKLNEIMKYLIVEYKT